MNITIHNYPNSPYIARAGVNVRDGNKIKFQLVMRDEQSARRWAAIQYPDAPIKVFNHK